MFEKIITNLTYFFLTVGNASFIYMSKISGEDTLNGFYFGLLGFAIFLGIMSYHKEMATLMSKKEEFVRHLNFFVFGIYTKPFFASIASYILVVLGYNIWAFLILFAGFGEYVLQKRVYSIISKK